MSQIDQGSLFATFSIVRTNGDTYTVLVDACDLDRVLAAGPWHVTPRPFHNAVYALRHVYVDGKRTTQRLHRFLFDAGGLQVDHINGDGLDNRRCNLRAASSAQNMRNRGNRRDNTSGFKGVCWHKQSAKWIAQIGHGGTQKRLGNYASPELAHAAYCEAAAKLYGEFARTA